MEAQSDYKRQDKQKEIDELRALYEQIVKDKDCVTTGELAINGKDLIRLRKYLNFGGSVYVFNGIDANGDSRINGLDLVTLRKYFAGYNDDTGISSYELGPR